MSKLTHLERKMLRYDGIPARDVAVHERCPVHEVLETRARLRARGLMPARPGTPDAAAATTAVEQLTFEDLDRAMRSNRCRSL